MQTRVSKSYFSKFQGFTNVSNTFINIIFIEVAERHAAIIFSPSHCRVSPCLFQQEMASLGMGTACGSSQSEHNGKWKTLNGAKVHEFGASNQILLSLFGFCWGWEGWAFLREKENSEINHIWEENSAL